MLTSRKEENASDATLPEAKAMKSPLRPTRKTLTWTAIIAAVLLIGGAFVIGSGFLKPKLAVSSAPSAVLTVSAENPTFRQIERQIEVNGSIWAWDPISVGSQAGGLEIKSMLVEEGAKVTKGQVLATLDSSLLLPQLASEKARLKAATANAKKSVQPNRQEDINGLEAAVSQAQANVADQQAALVQAQANLADAQTNVKRYAYLGQEGAVSDQELDTRTTNAKVCDAMVNSAQQRLAASKFALRQAREKLAMARIGGRQEDIQVADANVDEIKGNIKHLQAQIEQTFIRAPVNGLITRRDAHLGDIASAGKTMFDMARDSRLELRAQVAESDLAAMKAGETVEVKSAMTGAKILEGRVREISPAVDAQTRLGTVRIDIPADAGIKPGMYAEGRIQVGSSTALTVPARSVVTQDERSIVYVLIGDNKVQAHSVTTGARNGDVLEIKTGLTPTDMVAVDGAGFLKDGDYVRVSK